jgi:hypothetical protein
MAERRGAMLLIDDHYFGIVERQPLAGEQQADQTGQSGHQRERA